MRNVTVELPDHLYEQALGLRMPLQTICQRAIEAALENPLLTLADGDGMPAREGLTRDDKRRFEEGFAAGKAWAATAASLEELADVAKWNDERWSQISFRPSQHSLPLFYARYYNLPDPHPDEEFWLERSAFTQGLIAAAAAKLASVTG